MAKRKPKVCEHRGEPVEDAAGWRYECAHCGVKVCPDCGCTAAHEDDGYHCRRCAEKGGERSCFVAIVDRDLLRAKLGRELAAEVIAECVDDRYSIR